MEESFTTYRREPEYPPNKDAYHFDWFHVSGDLDDFIFYDEDDRGISER